MFRNQFIVFWVIILVSIKSHAQYFGGLGGGFSGISTLNLNLSFTDSLYNGGLSNGFFSVNNSTINLSFTDSLYNGGLGTGFLASISNINLAQQDSLYNGGTGNGENQLSVALIRLSLCNDKQLVWNGNQSVFWNNAANWDCGTVPVATSLVTIPASYTRVPAIGASAIASNITLQAQSTLVILKDIGKLTLTGQ
jgi:hypothetical protein